MDFWFDESDRIHVWYIYLHESHLNQKIGKYTVHQKEMEDVDRSNMSLVILPMLCC